MSWHNREIALAATAVMIVVSTLFFVTARPLIAVTVPPILYGVAGIVRAIRGDGKTKQGREVDNNTAELSENQAPDVDDRGDEVTDQDVVN